MTATVNTTPTAAASPFGRVRTRGVAAAGATAAVVGALVLYAYGTIAQAVEGKLYAGDPGASHAVRIPPEGFSIGVLFCVALGTVLAAVLNRRAKTPVRTWVRSSVALAALSIADPLVASHTDVSTKLTLAAGHVVAAAVAIPIIARRLSR